MPIKVENLEKTVAWLRAKAAKAAKSNVAVVVGFTAEYAIFVHENLEAVHLVGQAKFLEQPLRELKSELAGIVAKELKAGRTMAEALVKAGLRLQREAMKLCPVATDNLRASAFTRCWRLWCDGCLHPGVTPLRLYAP